MLADDAVAAIQRASRGVSPHSLFVTAASDGALVARARGGDLPLAQVYGTGEALVAAVARGEVGALGAALRGLACLDADAVCEAALALVRGAVAPELRRAAMFALAKSRADAALDALATVLDGAADAPCEALARAVHPGASARARAALDASGAARFAAVTWPLLGAAGSDGTGSPPATVATAWHETALAARAIGVLAARGDRGSVELIASMFEGHPERELRRACAEALAVLDEPRAHAALDARWADADAAVAAIAIGATLRREPIDAWRRFAPHTQAVLGETGGLADDAIVEQLLHAIAHAAPDRGVLAIEPRFLDLAARLRAHPRLGGAARGVLAAAPLAEAVAAIERYPRRGPRVTRGPVPARRDFVARYRAGEHAVWDELIGHAAAISLHTGLRDEAAEVAHEIMVRVRENCRAVGTFDAGVHEAGEPSNAAIAARLVELGGPLPLALDAMWRVCATLNLQPAKKLFIAAPFTFFHELAAYEQRCAETHREIVGPFVLPMILADPERDTLRHSIELPTTPLADAIDPVVVGTGLRLVAYLRAAFADIPGTQPF